MAGPQIPHLRIRSADITRVSSLFYGVPIPYHYGTFWFTVETDLSYIIDHLDDTGYPRFCWGPFLYDNGLYNGGELDIDVTKYGVGSYEGELFWTSHIPEHNSFQKFQQCSGENVTYLMTWLPEYIYWSATGGTEGFVDHKLTNPANNPPDTTGTMNMMVWLLGGTEESRAPPTDPYTIEIVLTDFNYVPLYQPGAEKVYFRNIAYKVS